MQNCVKPTLADKKTLTKTESISSGGLELESNLLQVSNDTDKNMEETVKGGLPASTLDNSSIQPNEEE